MGFCIIPTRSRLWVGSGKVTPGNTLLLRYFATDPICRSGLPERPAGYPFAIQRRLHSYWAGTELHH